MMIKEYLLEPFLAQYYLLDAVCGTFMDEKAQRKMFHELAGIFCIADSDELRDYFYDSGLDHFREIQDLGAYERLCRTIEFAQKSGQNIELTDRDRLILAQKREAMSIKSELFRQVRNLTRETVYTTLLNMATNGSVDAMVTLSYMEYHGICVCKDIDGALRRMRACAKWNNLFGNLMCIAYDKENKQAYYDRLYTILRGASRKQVFDHICKETAAKRTAQKNQIAQIIESAFGLGIIKRSTFDRVFAKIAFSEMISVEDKEKILLNKQKDAIFSLSEIPFDVKWEDTLEFDESCVSELPLRREAELRKILRNITVAKKCPVEACSPLLIVASDDYVSDMYCKMLKKGFDTSRVVEIDAGTLTAQDFVGGKENVFLRGLSDTKKKRTVFMLTHCEEMEEEQLDELVKMLDCEYRRKFKLFQPPVSLDLSGLVFVLLASGRSREIVRLAENCDTVWADRIDIAEKASVVDSLFRARSISFGCPTLKIEKGCTEFLSRFDPEKVRLIVDSALRNAIYEKNNKVTLASVKSVCEQENIAASKREFGYTGGNNRAKH